MANNRNPSQNRRADYRLDLSVPVFISYLDRETRRRKNSRGLTLNISATGVSIISHERLPENLHFIIHFQVKDLMATPQATILREVERENGTYVYHCKYENLSDDVESAIRSFVYRREALIRMKDKEKEAGTEA